MTSTEHLPFTKYTALGNDYLVFDGGHFGTTLDVQQIVRLCDRRFGVGADGILVHCPSLASGPFRVRIFNSDGSECERSGNGLRIYAQWLLDIGAVDRDRFEIDCLAGTSPVEVNNDGTLTVAMGPAVFEPHAIGLTDPSIDPQRFVLDTSAGALDVTALSVGNPHTVVFTPVEPHIQNTLGPQIATHPLFASGTNVQFVARIDAAGMDVDIWERGSGRTLASGSSACAAAAAALSRGSTTAPVTVRMPGGQLTVDRRGTQIWQTGRAHHVFAGTVRPPSPKAVAAL
ncbi:diaminopimelate epimerase [Rhodococcus pyridinivorans]|uniref:diaminopimelate epimerase n=1 Tax=Rhodococcus pyridinivorans TaxID=103816 RepID=UPI00200A825E|nr:diaminopimelate epimerase [Rhodococcus pyridinivorans]UPW04292.1 diaminopimelate epimerase [Rhodococcus pyridinivorans]